MPDDLQSRIYEAATAFETFWTQRLREMDLRLP